MRRFESKLLLAQKYPSIIAHCFAEDFVAADVVVVAAVGRGVGCSTVVGFEFWSLVARVVGVPSRFGRVCRVVGVVAFSRTIT